MTIFCYQLFLDEYHPDRYRHLLSQEEKKRADFYTSDLLSNRYVIGRGILKSILSHYLNTPAQDVLIYYGCQGKPLTEGIYFNLSHCIDNMVVCLSFDIDLGVDIEQMSANSWSNEAEKILFSYHENTHSQSLVFDLKLHYFFSVWTKKEAMLKCAGSGIDKDLTLLDTEKDSTYTFHALKVKEPYIAHIATKQPKVEVNYCQFTPLKRGHPF